MNKLTTHIYVKLRFNLFVLKSGKKVGLNETSFVRFLHTLFILHMFCHDHVIDLYSFFCSFV